MRIAAIYDIHGNEPALEAVLREVAQVRADVIVVGGDAVWGPMPRQTLAKLLQVDVPMHFVRGNADRIIIEQMSGQDVSGEVPEEGRAVAAWVAGQLESKHLELLSEWRDTVRLAAAGFGEVLFCHATPQDDTTIFTRLTPENRLLPIFDEVGADLVVCGHTHMQTDRQIGKVRVVNAGSVGRPNGEPGAYWLLIDSDVQFMHTLYDLEAAAGRVRATEYPEAEQFARGDILRPQSEAEILAIFEPRAIGGS